MATSYAQVDLLITNLITHHICSYCSLLMERENNIMDLEFKLHQLSDNQVDKENLLQTMESDKVALNRAMSQNKELKIQLAELQNSFVKMVINYGLIGNVFLVNIIIIMYI